MEAGWGFGAWVLELMRGLIAKAPFVAGVGVPESLGHLLGISCRSLGGWLRRLQSREALLGGGALTPVALACGRVAPGCELEVACADLVAVVHRFGRRGMRLTGMEFEREE